MDNPQDFLRSRAGKVTIILIIIAFFGVIAFFFIQHLSRQQFAKENYNPSASEVTIVKDTIADVDLSYINAEPENGNLPKTVHLIGFGLLIDYGYTYSQQEAIVTALQNYFSTSDDDIASLSLDKASFHYDPDSFRIAYFNLVSDNNIVFSVTIDTSASLFGATLILKDSAGKVLLDKYVSASE